MEARFEKEAVKFIEKIKLIEYFKCVVDGKLYQKFSYYPAWVHTFKIKTSKKV